MRGPIHERWQDLRAQAADEQDPQKLLELMDEINRLLAQKEKGSSDPPKHDIGSTQRLVTIRIGIDGEWDSSNFTQFFKALNDLYVAIGTMPATYRRGKFSGYPKVNAIQYQSPGFTDIAGVGAIMSEIRQLVQFLLERKDKAEERAAKVQAMSIANDRARIENARLLAGVSESPTSFDLLRWNQVAKASLSLDHLIERDLITSVDERPPNDAAEEGPKKKKR
jgi:hypothetical protein